MHILVLQSLEFFCIFRFHFSLTSLSVRTAVNLNTWVFIALTSPTWVRARLSTFSKVLKHFQFTFWFYIYIYVYNVSAPNSRFLAPFSSNVYRKHYSYFHSGTAVATALAACGCHKRSLFLSLFSYNLNVLPSNLCRLSSAIAPFSTKQFLFFFFSFFFYFSVYVPNAAMHFKRIMTLIPLKEKCRGPYWSNAENMKKYIFCKNIKSLKVKTFFLQFHVQTDVKCYCLLGRFMDPLSIKS